MILSIDTATISALGSAWLAVFLDASAKGAVLLCVAYAVRLALSKSSAAARHLVWFLTMAGLLVLPVLSFTMPGWRVLPAWFDVDPQGSSGTTEAASPRPEAAAATPPPASEPRPLSIAAPALRDAAPEDALGLQAEGPPPSGLDVETRTTSPEVRGWWISAGSRTRIVLLWMLGTIVTLLPVLLGAISLRRLGRAARRVHEGMRLDLVRRLSDQLGLRRRVVLLVSARRFMPMAWGLLHPRLLIPQEAAGWSPACLRAVLIHELAHIKRWDCLTQLVARIACALYWFNPLAWLALRHMVVEHERACDDVVLAAGGRAPEYAEHILKVASRLPLLPLTLGVGIALAWPSRLERRLRAILDGKRSRRAVTRTALVVGVTVLLALVLPLGALRGGARGAEENSGAATSGVVIADVGVVAEEIRTLDLRGKKATDADLARLRGIGDLQELYVSGEGITDAGLKELHGLKALRELHLWDGGFTDAGLAQLAGIENLEVLHLRAGRITPAGLRGLRNIKRLRELHLESLTISTDASLRELAEVQGLEVLRAGGASVTDAGLQELRGLTNLRELSLHQSRIEGDGLAALGGLQRLAVLDVGCTGVGDSDLKAIARLKGLRSLKLIATAITDAGLKELAGLPDLREVDLRWTKITDTGLKELKTLRTLRILDLRGTHISDAGLKEVAEIRTLEVLRLAGTDVTNAGLEELKAVKGLRELHVGSTRVTDEGLGALTALPALAVLHVNGAGITDAGLPALRVLPALRALNLGATAVTDVGLRALDDMKNLRAVHLAGAKVTDAGIARLREALPEVRVTTNDTDPDAMWPAVPPPPPRGAGEDSGAATSGVVIADVGVVAKDIRTLDLRGKKITDEDLRKLEGFDVLDELCLSGSGITDAGLKELRDLKALRVLRLVCCSKITDAGMAEVGELAGLRALDVVNTPVTDAGLGRLAGLRGLEALRVSGPKITDAGLTVLKRLKSLREVALLGPTFTDSGMKHLEGIEDLRALQLRAAGITDAGLRDIKAIGGLQALTLSDTSITDAGLKELKGLKALRELSLRYTKITDAGMQEIRGFGALRILDITYTSVTDAGLKALEGLDGLREVRCAGSSVTKAGVDRLRRALPQATITAFAEEAAADGGAAAASDPNLVRGIALSPDGKPAGDAAIVLVAPGYEARFRNARFEWQRGNRDEKPLDGMTTRTGPDGRFSLAARIPARVAVIIADAGYAERTPAQLADDPTVTLQPWGRVEGTTVRDGKPRPDRKLVLISGRAYDASGPAKGVWLREGANIRYEVDATSDAGGRFAFPMVPPGASVIRRGEGYAIVGSDIPIQVKAGETSTLVSGEPRTVIGRLVPPAGMELPKDSKAIQIVIELRAPRMLLPNDENELRLLNAYREFLASDEGKAYRLPDVKPAPDGTFRVKLAPASMYVLRARVLEDPPEGGGEARVSIAELATIISVPPAPSGRETEPVDVGRLALTSVLGLGRRAPSFEVKTLDGEAFRLADFRGKVVFIDFWATWCGPCRVEIPHLKSVFDAFGKDPRFVMIGLSLDQTSDPVKSFISANGIGWRQAVIPSGGEGSVAAAYGVRAIPSTFLIGPRGEILAIGLRGPGIRAAVEKALASEPR